MDYAINRTYDSKLGRFTQVDPIKMSAVSLTAPQTLNLYSYCGNDPINHTDANGLFWGFFKKLFKWLLAAIVVAVVVFAVMNFHLPVGAGVSLIGKFLAILGIVAQVSGAAATVLWAAGYVKASSILSLVSRVSNGIGNVLSAVTQKTRANQPQIIYGFKDSIRKVVERVVQRLVKNKTCLKTINVDKQEISPVDGLIYVYANPSGTNPSGINIVEGQKYIAETPSTGQAESGIIDLSDDFLTEALKDKKGNNWKKITGLNAQQTREFIILHELRHLYGSSHEGDAGLRADITKILKDCFNVKPNFSG